MEKCGVVKHSRIGRQTEWEVEEGLESTRKQLDNNSAVTQWFVAFCCNVIPGMQLKIHFKVSKIYVFPPCCFTDPCQPERRCVERCIRDSQTFFTTVKLYMQLSLLEMTGVCLESQRKFQSSPKESCDHAARLQSQTIKKPPPALPHFGLKTPRNVLFSHSSLCDFHLTCLVLSLLSCHLMIIIPKET